MRTGTPTHSSQQKYQPTPFPLARLPRCPTCQSTAALPSRMAVPVTAPPGEMQHPAPSRSVAAWPRGVAAVGRVEATASGVFAEAWVPIQDVWKEGVIFCVMADAGLHYGTAREPEERQYATILHCLHAASLSEMHCTADNNPPSPHSPGHCAGTAASGQAAAHHAHSAPGGPRRGAELPAGVHPAAPPRALTPRPAVMVTREFLVQADCRRPLSAPGCLPHTL